MKTAETTRSAERNRFVLEQKRIDIQVISLITRSPMS
jgi:hypothetical protein